MLALFGCMVLVFVGFITARILKKTGRLAEPPVVEEPSAASS
jgi:hypothetical protein